MVRPNARLNAFANGRSDRVRLADLLDASTRTMRIAEMFLKTVANKPSVACAGRLRYDL